MHHPSVNTISDPHTSATRIEHQSLSDDRGKPAVSGERLTDLCLYRIKSLGDSFSTDFLLRIFLEVLQPFKMMQRQQLTIRR